MTQPHWTAIFLGSGGVVGGAIAAITLVTNRLVDQKEERIRGLTRDNDELKSQIAEERHTSNKILGQFRDHLQSMDAGRFSEADKLRLQEAFGLLQELGSVLEGFKDCEKAANWLDSRRHIWAAEASEQAIGKYKRLFLLPRNKSAKFQENMEQYLEWVCLCLSKYGGRTVNVPMTEFIKTPAIKAVEPYLFAIKYLADEKDFNELNAMSRAYLRTVLVRSAKQLPSEFGQRHRSASRVM
jgi:hypothetical protein